MHFENELFDTFLYMLSERFELSVVLARTRNTIYTEKTASETNLFCSPSLLGITKAYPKRIGD